MIPAVVEPPKKSGPRAPIDVSTDLRQSTQVPDNLTGLSGVLEKPESSMNLFQIGSQSQSLQITTFFNIHTRDNKAEDLSLILQTSCFKLT